VKVAVLHFAGQISDCGAQFSGRPSESGRRVVADRYIASINRNLVWLVAAAFVVSYLSFQEYRDDVAATESIIAQSLYATFKSFVTQRTPLRTADLGKVYVPARVPEAILPLQTTLAVINSGAYAELSPEITAYAEKYVSIPGAYLIGPLYSRLNPRFSCYAAIFSGSHSVSVPISYSFDGPIYKALSADQVFLVNFSAACPLSLAGVKSILLLNDEENRTWLLGVPTTIRGWTSSDLLLGIQVRVIGNSLPFDLSG
jgi:hypothetical protein